jgi:serine protease Do
MHEGGVTVSTRTGRGRRPVAALALASVLLLLIAAAHGGGGAVAAAAAGTPTIIVDGRAVAGDVAPVIIDGRVMVPLRLVAESMGARVSWDDATRTVTIASSGGAGGDGAGGGVVTATGLDVPAIVDRVRPSVVGLWATYEDEEFPEDAEPGFAFGTGFVFDAAGYVVTAAHVVAGSSDIMVVLPDGQVTQGLLHRLDILSDVAIIRVSPLNLPVAPLGDSALVQVGEPVVAIGTPMTMGLRNTVTAGIISGIGRNVTGDYPLLQTDAAINPGNSGGPLLNARGEVIGIASAKWMEAGVEGLGFCVPINTVRWVWGELFEHGKVIRPWLGVVAEESTQASFGLPTDTGVKVVEVAPGQPAARFGLQRNDYILKVDGTPVNSLADLRQTLDRYQPGQNVTLAVRRMGVLQSLTLTLGEMPYDPTLAFHIGAQEWWQGEF